MPGSKSDLAKALSWLAQAGADEAAMEEPINRFELAHAGAVPPTRRRENGVSSHPASGSPDAAINTAPAFSGPQDSGPQDAIGLAMEIAAGCGSLAELKAALESFDGCTLKKNATRTVFADGTPDRRIMFIGEAPGREEDLAGLPFVGRAGKLLDKMLAAINLDRRSSVYITNVINWRPPDNREPTPEEVASCLPFLRRHIELVSPEIIVLLGAVATRHVMGRSEGIMRLRGNWLEYYVTGRKVPVMPTLHPAYLLRRPIDKKLAWRDLQQISTKVNSLGLLERQTQRG